MFNLALVLPNSIFYHAGRTAGHFVRKIVMDMNIPTYEVGNFHDWPSCINLSPEEENKLSFCFIRHPLSWLKSFWCIQMQRGWSLDEYSKSLQSDSFSEFLMKAVEIYPDGPVSAIFRPYLEQCKEVGRQENLKEDLHRILDLAGEEIVPSILSQARIIAVDIDHSISIAATAPRLVLDKVIKIEKNFIEQWGYRDFPVQLIGPSNFCYAPYVNLGLSKNSISLQDFKNSQGDNEIILNNQILPSAERKHRITGLAIINTLRDYDFQNKDVLDINCTDGAYCFYAESKKAKSVIGVNKDLPEVAEKLKNALDSKVTFLKKGFYGVDQHVNQRFDLVMCFKLLQRARYPFLLIRTLSRLMKKGGELILECDYLNGFDGVPILYCPLGSESPTHSFNCTFFNKKALVNILTSFGFHDFVFHKEIKMPVPYSRNYWDLPIEGKGNLHAIESGAGWLVMSCKWNPDIADIDSRYEADLVPGSYLLDGWDKGFSSNTLPEFAVNEEMLSRNRSQVGALSQSYNIALSKYEEAKTAILDRDKSLQGHRQQLQHFVAELESVRLTLIERTALLENSNLELHRVTSELISLRELLVERTKMLEAALAEKSKPNK